MEDWTLEEPKLEDSPTSAACPTSPSFRMEKQNKRSKKKGEKMYDLRELSLYIDKFNVRTAKKHDNRCITQQIENEHDQSVLFELPWLKAPFGIEGFERETNTKYTITLNVPDREVCFLESLISLDSAIKKVSSPDVMGLFGDEEKVEEAYIPICRKRSDGTRPCTIKLTLPTKNDMPLFTMFREGDVWPIQCQMDWINLVPRYSQVRTVCCLNNIWTNADRWGVTIKVMQMEFSEPEYVRQTRMFTLS